MGGISYNKQAGGSGTARSRDAVAGGRTIARFPLAAIWSGWGCLHHLGLDYPWQSRLIRTRRKSFNMSRLYPIFSLVRTPPAVLVLVLVRTPVRKPRSSPATGDGHS